MRLLATKKRRHVALAVVTVLGLLLVLGAQWLSTWQSTQVAEYNRGVQLLQEGDLPNALKAFDNSLAAYNAETQHRSWLEKQLLPPPSTEVAALAYKNEGLIFILAQKPENAINALKQSIILNPGVDIGLTRDEVNRLASQAHVSQYDLELLYKKNPSQQQQEGKGKGKGKGQGKQPAKGQPGQDPSNQAGKGDRNAI